MLRPWRGEGLDMGVKSETRIWNRLHATVCAPPAALLHAQISVEGMAFIQSTFKLKRRR